MARITNADLRDASESYRYTYRGETQRDNHMIGAMLRELMNMVEELTEENREIAIKVSNLESPPALPSPKKRRFWKRK